MTSTKSRLALLAIGGAHIDRRGQVAGPYFPGASNPGSMREEVGGVVFNALRVAVRRGVSGQLLSLRGGDTVGEAIARAIAAERIDDRSAVFLDRASASYTAIIDQAGDLIVGFADMGLYDQFPRQLRRSACRDAIASADAILCDANLPSAALDLATEASAGAKRYAIGISPAKVVRLAGLLDRLDCLFINRKEAVALSGVPVETPALAIVAALRERGLASAVITDGGGPAVVFDDVNIWAIEPPRPRRIADVTGAGDALAGATIAALMAGEPLPAAARHGMAAAMLTLETPNVVADLGQREFEQALAATPSAEILK
jgi:pseudouridine kinase